MTFDRAHAFKVSGWQWRTAAAPLRSRVSIFDLNYHLSSYCFYLQGSPRTVYRQVPVLDHVPNYHTLLFISGYAKPLLNPIKVDDSIFS